jgi:hypothetical protein
MNIPDSSFYRQNVNYLEEPQKTLGENWLTVLNFWRYLDKLTLEQKQVVNGRYIQAVEDSLIPFDYEGRLFDRVGGTRDFPYTRLEIDGLHYSVTTRTTFELILMDQLLSERKTLIFVPLFDSL